MGRSYDVDVAVNARKPKDRSSLEDEAGGRKGREDSDSSDDDDDELCQLQAWRYPLYTPSASYRQVDVVAGSHQYTIAG